VQCSLCARVAAARQGPILLTDVEGRAHAPQQLRCHKYIQALFVETFIRMVRSECHRAVRTWHRILSSALFLFEPIAIIVLVSNDATQSKTKCRANTGKDLTQRVKSTFEHKKCRVAGIKSHHQMRTLRGSWRVCVQPQVAHLCSPVARQSE